MKKIMTLVISVSIILTVSVDVYAQDTVRQKAAEERLAAEDSAEALGSADFTEPEVPETIKTDIAVSQKAIGQQIIECKSELKEIVKDAEVSLKKISKEPKLREKEIVKEKAEEEIAERKAEEEIAARKAEEEIVKKKAEEEIAAKKAAKEKLIAEQKAADRKAAQEAAAKKADEEMARKKAEEEAAAKKAEEEMAAKKAEEEIARQKGAQEFAGEVQASPAITTEEIVKKVDSFVTERIITSIPRLRYETAVPAQAPVPGEEVSAVYKDAVALYWESKYNEARMKFEQVQKASPEYARTSYYLGRVKEKLSK